MNKLIIYHFLKKVFYYINGMWYRIVSTVLYCQSATDQDLFCSCFLLDCSSLKKSIYVPSLQAAENKQRSLLQNKPFWPLFLLLLLCQHRNSTPRTQENTKKWHLVCCQLKPMLIIETGYDWTQQSMWALWLKKNMLKGFLYFVFYQGSLWQNICNMQCFNGLQDKLSNMHPEGLSLMANLKYPAFKRYLDRYMNRKDL